MADEGSDPLEELFVKELERLIAATEELESAPPEEPESVADAFAIATSEPTPSSSEPPAADPLLAPPGPPAADPLLTPPGPPAEPPMDAVAPGPPSSPPGPPASLSQPEFAPPPGAFGAPPGPPPSGPPAAPPMDAAPPGPPSAPPMDAVPPGPPSAPPMDAVPPGPPSAPPMDAAPPGPPSAPPMDAAPPGPPSGPPPNPPVDLSALGGPIDSVEPEIISPPPAPSMDALLPPGPPGPPSPPAPPMESPTAHFDAPEPIAPIEPAFDKVDIASWDSNWNEDWSNKADVYAKADPTHVPEAIQDDVDWETESDEPATEKSEKTAMPSEAALKKMKKAMLVELAKLRKVPSSGTKADIIARLIA